MLDKFRLKVHGGYIPVYAIRLCFNVSLSTFRITRSVVGVLLLVNVRRRLLNVKIPGLNKRNTISTLYLQSFRSPFLSLPR